MIEVRRSLLLLLMMIMLPWQAFSATAALLVYPGETGAVHAFSDEYAEAHHHHEDGSVHHDDSDASYQHLSEHASGNGAYGLFFASLSPPLALSGSASFNLREAFAGPPFLEGPHRPPRSLG